MVEITKNHKLYIINLLITFSYSRSSCTNMAHTLRRSDLGHRAAFLSPLNKRAQLRR
ncbi:BnaC02g45670D [Brassica napus]|uniref:BnaC02g45670D protein n=1 Tax=Brassica napus TaxID=3708 RepID=A0A078JEA5_BRANA|nr:BnaC02g45670D [Brassica napus]